MNRKPLRHRRISNRPYRVFPSISATANHSTRYAGIRRTDYVSDADSLSSYHANFRYAPARSSSSPHGSNPIANLIGSKLERASNSADTAGTPFRHIGEETQNFPIHVRNSRSNRVRGGELLVIQLPESDNGLRDAASTVGVAATSGPDAIAEGR